MSVHYQFKSAAKMRNVITFDSNAISVIALKRAIVAQQHMDETATDFDLRITNAQTHECYDHDDFEIPKNTSVTVRRVARVSGPKLRVMQTEVASHNDDCSDVSTLRVTRADGLKAEAIQKMLCQRCQLPGHQSFECRSVAAVAASAVHSHRAPLATHLTVSNINMTAAASINGGVLNHVTTASTTTASVPHDLMCSMCAKLLTQPVVTPCCYTTYCNACIRQHLVSHIDAGNAVCPACNSTDIDAASLKPNKGVDNKIKIYLIHHPHQLSHSSSSSSSLSSSSSSSSSCFTHTTAPSRVIAPRRVLGPSGPRVLRPSEGGAPLAKFCGRCAVEGHLSRDCPTVPAPSDIRLAAALMYRTRDPYQRSPPRFEPRRRSVSPPRRSRRRSRSPRRVSRSSRSRHRR